MPAPRVYIETFGCQMNELDSELVSGALRSMGYSFTADASAARVVLYNTCSVRDHAEQKVRSRLGEMALRKKEEPGLVVGVLGCMAERDGVDMLKRFPVVDILCGPGELDKLPAMVDNAVRTSAALGGSSEGIHRGDRGERGGIHREKGGEGRGAVPRAPITPPTSSPLPLHSSANSAFSAVKSESSAKSLSKQVALQGNASRRSATLAAAADSLEMLDLSRSVSPTDHNGSAYVRITRGCNKFCTYCVVPHTRGAEVHRPPEHIIDECKRLADAGVVEVTLLGQTVNHYRFEHASAVTVGGVVQPQKGRSFTGGHTRDPFAGAQVTTFADLLKRIHDEVPGILRLRFVTSYPRDFGDDVLEVIRDSPRICRYLHVPAQTGSDRMLTAMNRGYTISEYLGFIDRARAILHQPEINRPLTIAGDIIAGFCGETEADHLATAELLRRARYKNCFIFKYSPRPGTTAYDRLPDDVPEDVKRRRVNELLALQQTISDEISREHIGQTLGVFVSGLSARATKAAKRKERANVATGDGAGHHHHAAGVTLTISGRDPAGAEATDASNACTIDASHVFDRDSQSPTSHGPGVQLTGRTDGDLIVVFDCPTGMSPDDLIGRVVPVRVVDANQLTMSGEIAQDV
jgi:tRNA-2-methylthio-N6-dimethylallyladenosine synthase